MTLTLQIEIPEETAVWYQATTLAERLAASPYQALLNPSNFQATDNYNSAALQRLNRWRSQSPLNDEAIFKQCLTSYGITEAELLALLAEPLPFLEARFAGQNFAWIKTLEAGLALSKEACLLENLESTQLPLSENIQNPSLVGFLAVMRPFIMQARRKLRTALVTISQTYARVPFEMATVEDILLAGLATQLIQKLSPVMVMELHVARLQGQLTGATPEARFESFIQTLGQPETPAKIFKEYATLARQLITTLDNWVNFKLDFLHHLCTDWTELCELFSSGNDLGQLESIASNLGDGHRGGKMVLIAKFSSGLQLVYKPRSLGVDQHFQELLSWVNARGKQPAFPILAILSKADHGWVEFVKAAGCTSTAEIHRFYLRQGGYLALLYMLGATDFHYENLIASGEQPFLVDLEALFHPLVPTHAVTTTPQPAKDLVEEMVYYSVLRVGLLPNRVKTNKGKANLEISGLGGNAGQVTSYPAAYWENAGTDQMRLAYRSHEIPTSKNRPTINGADVNLSDYADAITQGFTNVYHLLIAGRDELLSNDGPLAKFGQDEVRVVLRPTQTYALLLKHNAQPDKLRDALSREPIFNKLWLDVKHHSYLGRVVEAERQDLHQGDIPIFTTRPASLHLWTSTGQLVSDFMSESSLESAHKRLQLLGEQDLTRQLWFINASLTAFSPNPEKQQTRPTTQNILDDELVNTIDVSAEQILKAARAIGNRLDELALHGDDQVNWVGLSLERLDDWFLAPLNLSIYDGLPGVALFLAYLGECTNEARYTKLAQAALSTIRRQIETEKATITTIGGLDGWGGLIYTLTHLGVLWNEPILLDQAVTLASEMLAPLIAKDEALDIITGTAGCIGVLLNLYRERPVRVVLEVAVKCGEHLLDKAQPQTQGLGWLTFMPVTQAATGFGRGSTGIGWALLKLASVSSDKRFREAGLAAIAYERHVFSVAQNNWPDYRTAGKDKLPKGTLRFMTAWCHGAPGIGLARLSLLPDLEGDELVLAEIEAALTNTLEQGSSFNHSLCHGDLGNLDFILEASRVLKDPTLAAKVEHLTANILADIQQRGWVCSTPLNVETPGMLVGLAGIGYGLLRLAAPHKVPSILTLEAPRPKQD